MVTEIIDGRTIIIQDKPNSRLTVQLQGIEVPDEKQPLSAVVKEHLGKMLLGKTVRVKMNGFTIGKVTVGDVDASGQMLRDGAAWYDLPQKSSHTQTDSENYLLLENAAKTEKRGVWGVEGLKPSWEFRAEQQKILEAQRLADEAALKQQPVTQKTQLTAEERAARRNASVQVWADVPITQTKTETRRSPSSRSSRNVSGESETTSTKQTAAHEKTIEAIDEMENLMAGLFGTDSLTDFQRRLGEVKIKVALAVDALPKDKLRVLMQENITLLNDLNNVMSFIIKQNINGIYYQGDGIKLSQTYGIEPVRAKSGKFILTQQAIFKALSEKALQNFLAIKKITG
jgi:endonuclease YncB( thermonuclease family)